MSLLMVFYCQRCEAQRLLQGNLSPVFLQNNGSLSFPQVDLGYSSEKVVVEYMQFSDTSYFALHHSN